VSIRPSRNGSGLFLVGILLAVLGGIAIAGEANNHAVCDSALGQLAQLDQHIRASCTTDNALFYVGIVVLVAGLVMLVIGSLQLSRPARPVSTVPVSSAGRPAPGWYPSPDHLGYVRWWDGVGWTGQEYPQAMPPPPTRLPPTGPPPPPSPPPPSPPPPSPPTASRPPAPQPPVVG
jgi:hypothetical protein